MEVRNRLPSHSLLSVRWQSWFFLTVRLLLNACGIARTYWTILAKMLEFYILTAIQEFSSESHHEITNLDLGRETTGGRAVDSDTKG